MLEEVDISNIASDCLLPMLTIPTHDYDLSLLIEIAAFYFFKPTCNHSLKITVA
jgi:hypothetical protein